MSLQFTCREAREEDRAELARIFLECRRAGSRWTGIRSPALDDFDRLTDGERIFVADSRSSDLLGFVSVFEPEQFVHHLFVAPGHERRGIGTGLIEYLSDWLPLPYRLKCAAANRRALAFYRATGWQETGRDQDHTGEYVEFELTRHLRASPGGDASHAR